MSALKDITGQRFGRLVAIRRSGSNAKGRAMWLFQCDCGNSHTAAGVDVRCGGTHCCGCLTGGRTHGLKGTRIYRIWSSMRNRCGHVGKGKRNYADRGIRVCDEWQKLDAFNAWARANGYDDGKQIDRIDNDGDYEPSNCRWVTQQENLNNRRDTPRMLFFGEEMTAEQAGRKFGLVPNTIRRRLRLGMAPDQAILEPMKKGRQRLPRFLGIKL
jgi:hypothetical protein